AGRLACRLERGALLVDGGFDLGLQRVDGLAEVAALLGRERRQRLHQRGELAGLPAQEGVVKRFERLVAGSRGELREERLGQSLDSGVIRHVLRRGARPWPAPPPWQ